MSFIDFNDPNQMAIFGALGNMLIAGGTPIKGQSGMGAGNAAALLGGAGLQGAVAGAGGAQKYQATDIANQTAGLGLERQKAIQPYQIKMIQSMLGGGAAPGSLSGGGGGSSPADRMFQQAYSLALSSGDMAKASSVLQAWAEHNPKLAGAIEQEKAKNAVHETAGGTMFGINGIPGAPAYGSMAPAGMNPMLPNLVQAESNGNPDAVSPAGAGGLTQIMPDTARDPGYGVQPLQGWDGKNPATALPQEQLRFGNDYLNAMQDHNGGDPRLAAAAYNAGPGRVDAALAKLPAETQAYVPKVAGQPQRTASFMPPARSLAAPQNAPDSSGMPKYKFSIFNKIEAHQAEKFGEADMKVSDEMSSQLNNYAQAEQRLESVERAAKAVQFGGLATKKAEIANMLQGLGVDPAKYNLDDPHSVYTVLHENIISALQQLRDSLKGSGGSRVAQTEFNRLVDKNFDPNSPPETILQLLGEAKGAIHYDRAMIEDWSKNGGLGNRIADGYTMRPNDFTRKWQLDHKMGDFVEKVKKDIGPLKGMESKNAPTSSVKVYKRVDGKLVAQ